jgi:hypothetical protein
MDSFQMGVVGIQRGFADMTQAGRDIARAGTTNPDADAADLGASIVQLEQGKLNVQASAKVIKTSSDSLGFLIDTLA